MAVGSYSVNFFSLEDVAADIYVKQEPLRKNHKCTTLKDAKYTVKLATGKATFLSHLYDWMQNVIEHIVQWLRFTEGANLILSITLGW